MMCDQAVVLSWRGSPFSFDGRISKSDGTLLIDTKQKGRSVIATFGGRPFSGGLCQGVEEALSSMQAGEVVCSPGLGIMLMSSTAQFGILSHLRHAAQSKASAASHINNTGMPMKAFIWLNACQLPCWKAQSWSVGYRMLSSLAPMPVLLHDAIGRASALAARQSSSAHMHISASGTAWRLLRC